MGVEINYGKLTHTSDPTYWSAAKKLFIPVPPADATKMVFSFRAYFDAYTANSLVSAGAGGAEPHGCFGLSFDGNAPTLANKGQFVGVFFDAGIRYNAVLSKTETPYLLINNVSGGTRRFHLGQAGSYLDGDGFYTEWQSSMTSFPPNMAVGQTFTGFWSFEKSDFYSTNNIKLTVGWNTETLSEANLQDAVSSATTIRVRPTTDIAAPAFRPGGGIVFPRWFHSQFSDAASGKRFVVEAIRADFYNPSGVIRYVDLT